MFEAEAQAAHAAEAAAPKPKPVEPMPTEEEIPSVGIDFEKSALTEPVKHMAI